MDKIKLNQVNIKKFYDEICNKYDYIFPLNEIQKKFMDNEIKGNRILDVGSSTGNLSKYLIENGINVTSIDINEKLIFKAAQKGVEVKKLNMLEIDTLNKFDTIINIGNTLPHLNNKKEIGLLTSDVKKVLPELVCTLKVEKTELIPDGILETLDYSKITALLVEVCKEQQKRIEELEKNVV